MANKEYTLTPTEGMETTVMLSDEDAERWGVKKQARSKAETPENKAATPEDKRGGTAAKVSNKGGG